MCVPGTGVWVCTRYNAVLVYLVQMDDFYQAPCCGNVSGTGR